MPQDTQELSAPGKSLQLFHHQVAGQSLVFQYDERTICKSLIAREELFYRTVPGVLKPFVPEYRGVVDIVLEKTEGGLLSQAHADSHVQAVQRHLDKVSKSNADEGAYHFILLENIVAGFRRPCILDLKLGTRQHGDDAPPEKVSYQVNKCLNTTSARLGVRLCGMKLFDPTTKTSVVLDKMEGRRMGEDGFRQAIETFFLAGNQFHKDIVSSILQRLRDLHSAIGQLPTYRFYACSLLIVYDGEAATDISITGSCLSPPGEEIAVVSHTSSGTERGSPANEDTATNNCAFDAKAPLQNGELLVVSDAEIDSPPDVAVVNARDAVDAESDSRVSVASSRRDDAFRRPSPSSHVSESCDGQASVAVETRPRRLDATEGGNASAQSNGCRSLPDTPCSDGLMTSATTAKSKIDVRMVDFAHATFEGFGSDQVLHEGVDRGCMLGLETLIRIISEMKLSSLFQ